MVLTVDNVGKPKGAALTRLAELIEQQKTTIRQLAVDSGIPERTVYRHVRGQSAMDENQIRAYAQALRVSVAAVLGVQP